MGGCGNNNLFNPIEQIWKKQWCVISWFVYGVISFVLRFPLDSILNFLFFLSLIFNFLSNFLFCFVLSAGINKKNLLVNKKKWKTNLTVDWNVFGFYQKVVWIAWDNIIRIMTRWDKNFRTKKGRKLRSKNRDFSFASSVREQDFLALPNRQKDIAAQPSVSLLLNNNCLLSIRGRKNQSMGEMEPTFFFSFLKRTWF